MTVTLKTIAAAGLLAAAASVASAAPLNLGRLADGANMSVIPVHGFHRSCERDQWGWHRHNRHGERRPCREWRGEGRRPDYCVRVGPVYYCDY